MEKVALITGSTSGIGMAFANLLAHKKYDLILVSRDKEKLYKQADLLSKQHGTKNYIIAEDLSKDGSAKKIYDEVLKICISPQIIINNAGFNECGKFIDTNTTQEKNMINLHINFTTEIMKLFIPHLITKQYGKILNIGSTGSYISCPNDAVYAATKAYILFVSKAINAELKGSGVTVTTLCPGATKTEFAKKAGIENSLLFKIFVMNPEKVAVIGYNAMIKGKSSVVAGLYNKLMVYSSKFIPISILDTITSKFIQI